MLVGFHGLQFSLVLVNLIRDLSEQVVSDVFKSLHVRGYWANGGIHLT